MWLVGEVRCGFEYGVFPRRDLAENWHVALGRRPIVRACESQEVPPREVRLLLTTHTSLFSKEIAHTFAWLAHARTVTLEFISLLRCRHCSQGKAGRCWPSRVAEQVAACKGHSRVRHFDGVFGFAVAAHAIYLSAALLELVSSGDPSTSVRVLRHSSALSSPPFSVIQQRCLHSCCQHLLQVDCAGVHVVCVL